jgi:hypothetical protein
MLCVSGNVTVQGLEFVWKLAFAAARWGSSRVDWTFVSRVICLCVGWLAGWLRL